MRETDEWFKLYKEGAGIRKIATEFKRHRTTVHNILVKKRKTIDVSDSFRS
jgi:transposase